MKTLLSLFALVALSGCFTTWDTPAELKPVGPPGWSDMVMIAADEWNVALESVGCDPVFTLGEEYPVTLVPADEWEYGPEMGGVTQTGGFDGLDIVDANIKIAANAENLYGVLLHELGHVLTGRGHTKDGIMAPTVTADVLTEQDAIYAKVQLGCE